jgi:hypothetical protein
LRHKLLFQWEEESPLLWNSCKASTEIPQLWIYRLVAG